MSELSEDLDDIWKRNMLTPARKSNPRILIDGPPNGCA